ncbi:MAG: response regulator transcription factor [Chitinophagaceae bacterium]|nr:response regulator transcription factor [Chitinophagaceae bacterium]
MKLLLVEDEKELCKNIISYLKEENYLCEIAPDFKTAISKVESYDYDCILLDISLPDGNGLNVLKELKANKKTDGVIIISAKNSIEDRIEGLNMGADDYLVKPFHLSELRARIGAVIRRRRLDGNKTIILNDLVIDTVARTICVGNKYLNLTRKEYDLLLYLGINKNRVLTKNAIAEHISNGEVDLFDNFDFLYAHMKNLKKKLTEAGVGEYIKSVYGMGYKFTV